MPLPDGQRKAERLFAGCRRLALPDPFLPHVTAVFLLEGPVGRCPPYGRTSLRRRSCAVRL